MPSHECEWQLIAETQDRQIAALKTDLDAALNELERIRHIAKDILKGKAGQLEERVADLEEELAFQKRMRVPCECGEEDACKLVQARDAALAEAKRLRGLLDTALNKG